MQKSCINLLVMRYVVIDVVMCILFTMRKYTIFKLFSFSFLIIASILSVNCKSAQCLKGQSDGGLVINEKHVLKPINFSKLKEALMQWHPDPFAYLSEIEFDSLLNYTVQNLPKDSVSETEFFYQLRRVFDNVTNGDPHFRFVCCPYLENDKDVKHLKLLPVTFLCINDTLMIDRSIDSRLKRGDRVVKIDGMPTDDFLKYTYRDRFFPASHMLSNYHFYYKESYKLTIERGRDCFDLAIDGISNLEYSKKKAPNILVDLKQGYGYIRINEFKNNQEIIKRLSALIDQVKRNGGQTIVLDIRQNAGGTGEDFDELISLFCDKPTIPFQAKELLKVSEATLDYGFSRDSIGKLISLPDTMFYREVLLQPDRYKGPMNVYVIVSKNTGSIAATFANILQFNNIATIVGEPLKRNALKFGEVIKVNLLHSYAVVSTTESDVYTNAINGVLYPDIPIPYIASEYMNGGDPVLEKLLRYLKNKKL